MRSVGERAPVGLCVVSLREARCLFANEALAEFLGLARSALTSGDAHELWLRLTHADDVEAERRALRELAQGGGARWQVERRFVRGDGTLRWGLVTATLARDADGVVDLVVACVVDIHERRERELRRLDAERGHGQRLSALGQLAGGVAHDFNNRLVVILGHAELMRERMPAGDPLREHLDQVIDSARRSAELTQQLLAFSRRQALAPTVFDLNATVEQMRKMLSRLLGGGIALTASLEASGAVFADPGQVEEIVLNLALTARDAMPSGGRLGIVTRDVDDAPDDLAPGPYVELAVSDTGHGIAPDLLPRIFEPFFTTKPAGAGTGLGLATVLAIARQSGGSVRVTSAPGEGATFAVLLPRAPRPALGRSRSPAPGFALKSVARTVVLVDGDDDVRRLLGDVIGRRGLRVIAAASGAQALVLAREAAHVDLVATDLGPGGLDGPELVRRLRLVHPGVPALFIGGHADATALAAALGSAHATLLPKPFSPAELIRAVEALLALGPATLRVPRPSLVNG
ncbi:MAG: ATP-binding protein [Myxococcota bacterium]